MKLQVIIGSTRPERVSNRVAKWVANTAGSLNDTMIEIVDLADFELPFFNEAISPQYNPDRKPEAVTKQWLDKLSEADAYVLVTPEYNRSYSAVLKNALDFIDYQFAKKPVMLVSHGSSGGAQAIAHLRGVIPGLQSMTIPTAVYLVGRVGDMIDEAGALDETVKANPYGPQAALQGGLNELKWYSDALIAARPIS